MSRITLKSSNTAVILADSPAFKTVDESGSLFAGVTSASFGFSTNRQALSQLGYKDLAVNDIIRSPDVDLSLTYNYTPTYANEDLMGLNFSLDEKSEFSLMSTLKDKSYNFYFYNNPEQGEDGTQSLKEQNFLPGGEIISFGNAYLNRYSMDFQVGSYPTVSVGFQCSNVESEKYYGVNTKSPAINLESGNAVGVGDFDITKTQIYKEGVFGGVVGIDRSKLPSVTPSELEFTLQDLEIGGQKLSPNNHILSSFKFEMDVERASYYKLGSNYACGRDIKYPINAKVSIASLVNSYENGFISGLVVGEEINFLDIVAKDCSGVLTSKLFFENLKIERVQYDMLVNESMNYSLDLTLKINDEEGFKTYITEEEWKATRVYDSAGNIDDSNFGDIEPEWKINDDSIYAIKFADFFSYEIGDRAFYDCNNVSGKLFFPRNVNYIGESSFENCSEVKEIFFDTDHTITSIGSSGFKGCSGISMSNLLLPGSLDIIGSSCFEDCINIQGINLNKVSSIGDRSFYNCNSLNGPLALREGVNYLGESAFEDCTSLNGSIEFPDSLDYISRYSFRNCGALSYDLVINDSITGIGEQAFYGCSGLNGELTLSNALTYIESGTFYNCFSITGDLVIPSSVSGVGEYSFYNLGVDSLYLPESLKYISEGAFERLNDIKTDLVLPSGIVSIGDRAFADCDSLQEKLVIPSGIQSIGEHSFSGCVGIEDVFINSPTSIFQGSNAFDGIKGCLYVTPVYYYSYVSQLVNGKYQGMPVCLGAEDSIVFDAVTYEILQTKRGIIPSNWYSNKTRPSFLVVGNTCKGIEANAFVDSVGLVGDLGLGSGVKYIGENAFKNCSFSGDLIIDDATTGIGSGAFENCSNFDGNLQIPYNLDLIYANTFRNCSGLESPLIMPPRVGRIEDGAFENCSKLNGFLSLPSRCEYIGVKSFANCNSLSGSLIVPDLCTGIGGAAFLNCYSLNGGLSLPTSLEYIGDSGFYNCESLSGLLQIPSTIQYLGDYSFYNCAGFNGDLLLPDELETVRVSTFENCSGFEGDLIIPRSCSGIEARSFYNCSSFSGAIVITDIAAQNIGQDALFNTNFVQLVVHDNVLDISEGEFDYFKNYAVELTLQEGLASVSNNAFKNYAFTGDFFLPGSVSIIGDAAFQNVQFDGEYLFSQGGVVSIGSGAFKNCGGISGDLIFNNNLFYIGDEAFRNNTSLNGELILPGLIETIGDYAFAGNVSMNGNIYMPDSLSGLGQGAFLNCSSLDGLLTISKNAFLTEIKTETFKNCTNISGDLFLPDNIINVQTQAFKNCSNLDGIVTLTDTAALSLIGKDALDESNFDHLHVSSSVKEISDGEFDYFQNKVLTLTLPEEITGILSNSFDNYAIIGSLIFPGDLLYIGDNAFKNCNGLNSGLIFPQSLTGIGESAFEECTNLSGDLNLPIQLSGVGARSFYNCIGLDGELTISDFTASSVSLSDDSFFGTRFSLLRAESIDGDISDGEFDVLSADFTGSLDIGQSVSVVGEKAFDDFLFLGNFLSSGALSSIGVSAFSGVDFIGNYEAALVTEIESDAFRDCGFDGSIIFYDSTEYIGDRAFYNCTGFSGDLKLTSSLISIGDFAFYNCTGLNGEFILSDPGLPITDPTTFISQLDTIGSHAFDGCTGLSGNLIIQGNINSIGSYAFYGCQSLDGYMYIGSGLSIIEESTFRNCSNLSGYSGELLIPAAVTNIRANAFNGCSSLSGSLIISSIAARNTETNAFLGTNFDNITVLTGSLSIIDGDFDYFQQTGVTLTLNDDLKSLESGAFDDFSFIGGLTIPATVTGIGKDAFRNNDGFNGSLTIPSGTTLVDDFAFSGCIGFNGLIFDDYQFNKVSTIGSGAFKDCVGFEGSLLIPSNLITIGDSAFENCYGFTAGLSFQSGIESIGFRSFAGCSGFDGEYNFSNASNLNTIGAYAFADCINFVGDLTIPDGIVWGEYAFLNNRSLDGNLILGEGLEEIPEGSFKGCSLIQAPNTRLEIPRSVNLIGDYAFQGSDLILLGEIKIKGGVDIGIDALEPFNFGTLIVPDYEVTLENADYEYFKPKNIQLEFENYISSDLRILQNNCFSGYNFVGNLQLPYLLETIGNYAFYEASGFDGDLIISPNLETIGERAFYNCSGFDGEFRLVDLPANYNGETNLNSSLSYIDRYAFANCTNWSGNLVIPDGVVCQDFAFLNNHSLDGFLILNNTETTIKEGVFQDCSGLKCFEGVFKIPESVTFINRDAFKNCVSLDCKLQISSDVFIGSNAFAGTNFQGLVVPEYVEEILFGNYDYFKNNSITIDFENYNSASNQTITIGDNAFEGYNFSGELKLPNALETIGDRAFYGLDTLEGGLIIPDSVNSIGSGAFEDCSGLFGSFLFPRSIQNIGPYAFKNCKDLVYNPKFDPGLVSIGEEAFSNCISLNGIVELPINTQSIGSGAFLNASGLGGILITSFGVNVFEGENAFSGVGGVLQLSPEVYLEYENASTEINGDYYFQGIKISGQIANDTIFFTGFDSNRINAEQDAVDGRLTDTNNQGYAIPNNWKQGLTSDPAYGGINTQVINSWIEIGGLCEAVSSQAFMDRKYLRDLVSFPQSVRTIGSQAFKGCTGVTELGFTSYGLEDIRDGAFTGLQYVTSDIDLPYTLSNIGEKAFYGLTRAGDLTIKGDLLETIPYQAFYNYGSNAPNKTIKLNSGLLEISGDAFYDAGGVGTSLELPDTIQTIGDSAFNRFGGGNSASVMGSINDLPRDLTSLGAYAFQYSTITGDINIPSGLTRIPYRGFQGSYITTVSGLSGVDEIARDAFTSSKISNDIIIGNDTFLAYNCFSSCSNLTYVSLSGNYPYNTAFYSGGIDWRGFQIYNNPSLRTVHTSGIQQIPYYFAASCPSLRLDEYSLGYETSGINGYAFQSSSTNYVNYYQYIDGVDPYVPQSRICIPSGVVEIGVSAFNGNKITEKLTYSGSQSGLVIGQTAFKDVGDYVYNVRYARYGEPGERSYYWPSGPNSYWPQVNVTGHFVTASGMRYLGNGAFQNFRGRDVDFVFADDFTGSIDPGTSVNDPDSLRYKKSNSNGGGNTDGGYWIMHPASIESTIFQDAQVKSLHLPSGLQRIGNYAMKGLTIMDHNNLDLPLNPKTIGDNACYTLNCETGDGVFTLEMGSGLESIGIEAFANQGHPLNDGQSGTVNDSSNLTSLPLVHKISGVQKFHRCVESIDFSNVSGAVSFGNKALQRSWLSGVLELPEINTMGTQVFQYAHYLEQIVFKSSPNFTNIPNSTFANLLGLSGVVFNEELTSIGSNVFENCPSLVDFDISLTDIESMGGSVFKNCANLANIKLANGKITTLGAKVFENCTSIDDLYIPNSITSVGSDLFLNANINILFYDVAGTVLEAGLFNGSTIGELRLPTTTLTVKESVFENCIFGPDPFNGLPDGVQTFESRVFFGIGLSGVDIPTSLTGFVNETFRNASNLSGLDMTACTSFEGIGDDNFIGCTSLEEVIFPASMLSMGDRNFKGLNQIEEVSLGNGLEIMGNNNYQNCSGLTFVNLANTNLIEIGDDNFIEDSNTKVIASLEFPPSLKIIGSRNFKDIAVDTLILPNNIKTIGDENFYDCQPSIGEWNGAGGAGDNLFIIPSGLETMGDYNWYQSDGIQRLKIEAGSSGSFGDYNWNKCNQLSELFIKTTDSNFTLGEENFSDCLLLELVEIDCPLSSWVGTGNLRAAKFSVLVKINSAYYSSYISSTWSGDQGLPIESTIISYNPQ